MDFQRELRQRSDEVAREVDQELGFVEEQDRDPRYADGAVYFDDGSGSEGRAYTELRNGEKASRSGSQPVLTMVFLLR